MLAILWYLAKMIICSAILYGYYWLMLRNKLYHSYNRFYLLALVVLSISLPLLKFTYNSSSSEIPVIQLLGTVQSNEAFMQEMIGNAQAQQFSAGQFVLLFYSLIVVMLAVSFVMMLMKIFRLKRNNPVEHFPEVDIITVSDKASPFSFFRNIFWNKEIDIESTGGQHILKHELAHVTEHHSADKLFVNIVLIFFWCNPVFWLLRKELSMIHEFIADKKAVEDGDTAAFAQMILAATYPTQQFTISNHFFYSPIKRRLAMLTKKNKASIRYVSRLLVLPLAAIVFAAFSLQADKLPLQLPIEKTIKVVIDAGHGGTDAGAVIDGIKEKDLTLALAKKIKELNNYKNVEIILTRSTDIYQSPREKADYANAQNADLFISIHIEGQDIREVLKTGMNVYVAKEGYANVAMSKLFASAAIQVFIQNYGLSTPEFPAQRQMGIWVLQESKAPAILIEAGYITNPVDRNYLLSEKGQTAFAENVLKTIVSFAAAKEFSAGKINNSPSVQETSTVDSSFSITNFKANITTKNQLLKDVLIVLDGKIVNEADINWNKLHAKTVTIYKKNDPEMLKKYGEKARKGVWFFEELTEKTKSNEDLAYQISADQVIVMDASERKNNAYADKTGAKNIIFIVDGKKMNNAEAKLILAENIKKIDVITGTKAIETYGDAGKDGVIVITTKDLTTVEVQGRPGSASSNRNADKMQSVNNSMEEVVVTGKLIVTPSDPGHQDNKVFTQVETPAQFPGGQDAWRMYLRKNLNLATPVAEGWDAGIYKIMVQFMVEKDGSIRNIRTLNYTGSKTAAECIDLIKNGPKWTPALQNGHVVISYREEAISFVIAN